MSTSSDRRVSTRRGSFAAILLALLPVLVAAPAAAAAEAKDEALRSAVMTRFDVLPLRSGLVLRPHGEADYHAVEFADGGVAVDGETLTGRALRDRLGDDFELVDRLSRLSESERRALLRPSPGEPGVPPPPSPPEPPSPRHRRDGSEAKVSIGSSATVAKGEVAHDVVVIGGSIDVEGEVLGDAVAVGGSAEVNGRVTGDVVAVGGGVRLGPTAEVLGNVSSVGGHVERDAGAKVIGKVDEVALGPLLRLGAMHHGRIHLGERSAVGVVTRTFVSLLVLGVFALLLCLVVLLVRAPLERVSDKVAADPWRAGLTGLAAQVLFLPLAFLIGIVLIVSIIGIPLLVVALFVVPVALALFSLLGYSAVAQRVGRWSEARFGWKLGNPYLVVLAGLVLIQVWTIPARLLDWGFFPMNVVSLLGLFLGLLVQYVAWTVGFGAVLLTRFGTQDEWRRKPLPPAETGGGGGAPVVEPPVGPATAAEPSQMQASSEAGTRPGTGEAPPSEPPTAS